MFPRLVAALASLVALFALRATAGAAAVSSPAAWAGVAVDLPGDISVEQVAALPAARFTVYDPQHTRRAAPNDHSPVWLKLRLPAIGEHAQPAVLVVGRGYEDYVDVFLPDGSGGWRRLRSGEAVPQSDRTLPGLRTAFPVTLPARGQETLAYVRILDPWLEEWTVRLEPDAAAFASAQQWEIAVYFAYFGALGAIFAYNLFLYLRLRYRDLLFYLCYVGVFGVMMAIETFAIALVAPLHGAWRNSGTFALTNVAFGFLLLFVREYHELPRRAPRLGRIVTGGAVIFFAEFAIVWADFRQPIGLLVYRVASILVLAAMAGLPVVSVLAWRRGAQQARYFLLAFGCYVLGVMVATANTMFHFLPPHADNFFPLGGSAVEFVLLSFAIGDRFRRIRDEKEALQANYTAELERDVAARTAALVRLNLEKDELMGVVAHDLRAPLAALRGTAQLVRASPTLTAPDDREALDEIGAAADRMHQLASDLLGRHAAESGQVPVHLIAADTRPALAAAARRFRDVAAAKQQSIVSELSAEPLPARHDPALLAQVLDNLVSNALKFSPPQTIVRLSAMPGREGGVWLGVHDAGPGLSEADRTKLFQPFARLDARPTAGEGSTGFGLAAARKLTVAMGGRIEADNSPDGGAVFWIELPNVDTPA